jgi:peroxiredoxin
MRASSTAVALLLAAASFAGCSEAPPAAPDAPKAAAASATASARATTVGAARVGEPAPDFTLRDLDGKEVTLSSFRGKRVVLEWFNPGCPFVEKSHTAGSLKTLAGEATAKGVVWLAINSGAAGKQGHGVEANRAGASRFGLSHPILLDEDGAVGRRYGAARTPQMFVVDERGVVAYAGAIDNSPDAEGQSPEGGTLRNHVADALAALDAGKPVSPAETKPYGCSVKY